MQDIFTHNWYNRNNENYVYGPAFPVYGYLTDTLYTQAEVVKMFADYKLIEDELKSILFNRFNIKVNIKISDTTEDSYTDGKNIVIKSMKEITNNYDRLDMIFGIAFHEISHCLFTDFKYGKSKHIFSNPLLHHIENILEDEEIENRIVKKHSGYGKYLAKVKYELFGKGCASAENLRKKSKNDLDDIMKILFCVIRYPKNIMNINQDILKKYQDLFIKINNILINANCPAAVPFVNCSMYESSYYDKLSITPTTMTAAFEIYKYLADYIPDFNKQRKECEHDDSFTGRSANKVRTPEQLENDINAEFGVVITHDDEYTGWHTGDDVSKNTDRVRFGNPERYNKFFNSIKQYIPFVEKAIIPNDVKMKDALEICRFRRNGNLDTNRLAEAMQNINTIYNQRFTIKKPTSKSEPKYAFVIMMDESGSMKTYDHRNEFSVKIAILFYEVLSKFNGIELFVYGHGDKINSYITKENRDKFVLGNFDCQGCQNEEYSYRWIINDVKRQTNLPIVVLNITDFYYHAKDEMLCNMFENFRKSNISFNMLNLGTKHTPREIAMCKRVLEGQVVPLSEIDNPDRVKEAIQKLATIINDNYKKYNKK